MAKVAVGTPLAEALSNAIQPKLVEMGWSSDSSDSALTEYVILMLVNGKTQEQIASELSNDLLGLGEGDTQALDFSRWLFEQVQIFDQQINGGAAPATENASAQAIPSFDDQETAAFQQQGLEGESQNVDMNMGDAGSGADGIPTGPKSMRNNRQNGGRGRMLNQINRSLERDNGLHRIRDQTGSGRINSHGRAGSRGGRFNQNGNGRMYGGRQQGGMGMGNNPMAGGPGNLMNMNPNDQMHLMSLLEEQARMMAQFMPGFVSPAINPAFQQPGSGRSLSDRVERPRGGRQQGGFGNRKPQNSTNTDNGGQDESNPDSVCHFNLRCTRKDCPFAHQSPAAPEGTPIDVSDHCSFGAACKNRKCSGRHPSPAVRSAHQAEELCRFFPHCTNPNCHFKHPSMPLCRNGADCTTEGCKFTHLQIACKFNPCLNPNCTYKHAEGQRGSFPDKVWTPGSNKAPISERKFVNDEEAPEELIKPGAGADSSSQEIPPFLRNGLRRSLHNQTQQFTAAVVGGGITGLTAAYRLSKDPLCSKVTIYEKEKRLGGWLESETIEVDGGKVVFEYGPRTLRVGTLSCGPLLDLLLDLNLEDQILLTPKSAPASKNRYIYYPDRLVQMPSFRDGPFQLAQKVSGEPLFDTLITSLFKEAFMSPPKGKPQDESIMDFVSRRFSPTIANNLVSSIWHGILAGNIDRLSAEALMGRFRALEDNHGSIIGSLFALERQGKQVVGVDDLLARNVIAETKSTSYLGALGGLTEDSSTLTLKNGVGQLVDTLVEALRSSPKVEILTDQTLFQIKQNPKTLDLTIENAPQPDGRVHNRAIVTCSPVDLVIQSSSKNEVKNETARPLSGAAFSFEAVTVMVVNLYYPNPDLIPVKGFGYLIPRSIPYEQNPERALGVIFASDSSVGQDTAPGTKLTVMLGGHYWDGWKCEDYPDSETAVAMARSLLERHLGVTDTPTVTRTRLQKDAIPQPTVGHFDRMGKLSQVVREQYNNRVALAGAWYAMGNTGVVDSIRQAYLATFYGIKPRQPGSGKLLPWLPESESWELEGGVPTSPIREIIIYKDELKDREDD
ncbi:Protoporphyrinogen oxidase [Aspergillus karnatakaensis]|uniref:Protoporphyrinogen oxidase n=1 Tax=Aspergillus karnatakaensis TaxID=1810916 RepID=UPI003CCCA9F1